jgi:uncharacterized protein (TIGR00730 family)
MKKSVVVFCGSSSMVNAFYHEQMRLVAIEIVKSGLRTVYGGGVWGLMGTLCHQVVASQGSITGVVTEKLSGKESVVPPEVEVVMTDSLSARKTKMIAMSDGAIVFPGGLGTLDEVTDVLAMGFAGERKVPLVFYNFMNFWDPFLHFIEELRMRGMVYHPTEEMFSVVDSIDGLKSWLQQIHDGQAGPSI